MALHHFLPDLIVPIDRKSTRAFFAWHVPEFQYQQERVFRHAFRHFRRIALATNPEQYVATGGWKTSRTKVIDNAVVAFCVQENLRAHGQRRRSLRGVGRREVLAD